MRFQILFIALALLIGLTAVSTLSSNADKLPTSQIEKKWLDWFKKISWKSATTRSSSSSSASDTSPNETTIPEDETKFKGQVWAVLVAGSNGYDNYRHQADVCHAYQVLRRNGLPDERIIVMMYDDIAFNRENPFPGQIINEPNGTNVYVNVPKDYTGKDVNPDTFLKILKGDSQLLKSGRKTLNSGPNDHVFVYFCDHGGPGLLAFPYETLGARVLNDALQEMYISKRFSQLLFYVEACESGSMFDGQLSANESILAITAANPYEPSNACFFDEIRGTFLSDVFSYAWLQDAKSMSAHRKETVETQMEHVRKNTNTSHVSVFGDNRVASRPCAQFEANPAPREENSNVTDADDHTRYLIVENNAFIDSQIDNVDKQSAGVVKQNHPWSKLFTVPTPHVSLFLAKWRARVRTGSAATRAAADYKRLVAGRKLVDLAMHKVAEKFARILKRDVRQIEKELLPVRSFNCYEPMLQQLEKHCFRPAQHSYVLRKLRPLVNACEYWTADGANETVLQQLFDAVEAQCSTSTSSLFQLGSIH